jgi:hypothetical protein
LGKYAEGSAATVSDAESVRENTMLGFHCTTGSAISGSRRQLLGLGCSALSVFGSGDTASARQTVTEQTPGFGRAKSVIVVFASGGQSQLDMWDPKPDAPREIRGAFESIATAVPGLRFCEHMPRIARVADRLTVVRSMSHEDLDHGSAFYLAMTGRYHRRKSGNPPPASDDQPCCSSILQRVRPSLTAPQTAVHLNGPAVVPELPAPGQYGGFLGRGFDPLTLGDVSRDFNAIPSLLPQPDLPQLRLDARRGLLQQIESQMPLLERHQLLLEKHAMYRQAFDMLANSRARGAFDLSDEPDSVKDRYGRNQSGQACLLARRLAEAEVPLITVFWSPSNRGQDREPDNTDLWGWDTHNDIFDGLRRHLLPRFDQGFSALIEDLDQRGLLETTLVICMGEFGRAPLVALEPRFAGALPGRKHWSSVYSIAFAGAGVRRGTVLGASDDRGAWPAEQAWGPWDVTATIFAALGIDPAQHYRDPVDRPIRISDGSVMSKIYTG